MTEEFVHVAQKLLQSDSMGAFGGAQMPEDTVPGIVKDDDMSNVLTLGPSLNYQRNSYSPWKNKSLSCVDGNCTWIKDPRPVKGVDIRELRHSLLKHGVGAIHMRNEKNLKCPYCENKFVEKREWR